MEQYQLSNGARLPEVYSFGFSGTHFQIFLQEQYWLHFVEMAGEETYFASHQDPCYSPPGTNKASFGFQECAQITHTLDGSVCIQVPAFSTSTGDKQSLDVRFYALTIQLILFVLRVIIDKVSKEKVENVSCPQLFVVETYIGSPDQHFHAAGLELTLSSFARVFLEKMGTNVRLDGAMKAMLCHSNSFCQRETGSTSSYLKHSFSVYTRTNGVLHMNTEGNCACMGTMPRNFSENEGCYLHSHNVDTIYQQFSLLVGIAYIWQMVRDGLKNK